MKLKITGSIWYMKPIVDAIENATEKVELTINSPGGYVVEALNVVNAIQKCKFPVVANIEVMACSAAAVIAMVCDEVYMQAHGILMVHNSWGAAVGNKHDFQEVIDRMNAFDAAMHSALEIHCKDKEILAKMEAGDVWLLGKDAVNSFDNIELVEAPKREGVLAAEVDMSAMVSFLEKASTEDEDPDEKDQGKDEPEKKEPNTEDEKPKTTEEPDDEPDEEPEPESPADDPEDNPEAEPEDKKPKQSYDPVMMALI
jgi:hypothetical protein